MNLSAYSVAQSCPTLWNPMDCSLPGSFVHGISQAILEWVAIEIGELYHYYLKKLLGPGISWRTKLFCLAVRPPPNPALTQLSLTTRRLWSKQTVTIRSSPVIALISTMHQQQILEQTSVSGKKDMWTPRMHLHRQFGKHWTNIKFFSPLGLQTRVLTAWDKWSDN